MKITLEKETDYKGEIWFVIIIDNDKKVWFINEEKARKRFQELKANGLEPNVLLDEFETHTE